MLASKRFVSGVRALAGSASLTLLLLLCVYGIHHHGVNDSRLESFTETSDIDAEISAPVTFFHPQYAADFSDDRILVGAAHNIFIGKVIKETGVRESRIGVETQYEVEIVDNIKGSLLKRVTVNQYGGYVGRTLVVVADNEENPPTDYLIKPGSTYLFATRYNEKENWHTLNSYPTARKLLSTDANASAGDLKSQALADSRVKELQAAYPQEILLEADVANGKAYNDYETRNPLPANTD